MLASIKESLFRFPYSWRLLGSSTNAVVLEVWRQIVGYLYANPPMCSGISIFCGNLYLSFPFPFFVLASVLYHPIQRFYYMFLGSFIILSLLPLLDIKRESPYWMCHLQVENWSLTRDAMITIMQTFSRESSLSQRTVFFSLVFLVCLFLSFILFYFNAAVPLLR